MNQETREGLRFDVYQAVTEKIISAIEAGAGEFQMPWHGDGAAIAKPENVHTRMEYHGLNVVALWAQACSAGYATGIWGTYRQWQKVGAQVRKGEHSSLIVFFKRMETKDAEGQPSERLIARASRVFNGDQVTGWERPETKNWQGTAELSESVQTFVSRTGARIAYGGAQAYYAVGSDRIQMPDRNRFIGTSTSTAEEALTATLLHELVHWTGATHRLNRGLGKDLTKTSLAEEELIAELGAAFLCADLGVTNTPRQDHAAYVASWLTALRSDKRAIFRAARQANQAAGFLHEVVGANL